MLEVESLPNKRFTHFPVIEAFSFLLEYGLAGWKANKQWKQSLAQKPSLFSIDSVLSLKHDYIKYTG
jgi:hypothetical protein